MTRPSLKVKEFLIKISNSIYIISLLTSGRVHFLHYFSKGLKYQWECSKETFNNKGKKTSEEDLTSFIQTEGGVLCGTVLFISLLRALAICDRRRKQQKSRSELEEQKKRGGFLFMLCLGLYLANFGLCVAGKLSDNWNVINGRTPLHGWNIIADTT